MRVRLFMSALAGLMAVCGSSALADFNFHVKLQSQPQAPLQINTCYASEHLWSGHFYLDSAVTFTNISPKTMDAVEFRFYFEDYFGDVLGWEVGQRDGTFSPNALINLRHGLTDQWQTSSYVPSLTKVVECAVSRVRFDDGTVWQEGNVYPTPTPAPIPIQNQPTPAP
jgi:hypothetical protein